MNHLRLLRWLGIAALISCVLLLLLFGSWQLARSRHFQLFGKLVWRVETTDSIIALTFDDGPVPVLTDSIIRVLARRGASATFFVMGSEIANDPEQAAKLVRAGHELGNHTYSHNRMILRSPGFIRREIESTDSLIRAAGQTDPIYFRPPFTYKLVGLPFYLWRRGRTTVTVDIEPDSYEDVAATSAGIVAHVLGRVRPGSMILLHPWYTSRKTSLEAIPSLVDSLQARGYRVTTVRELLLHDEMAKIQRYP
jgi:peptidoglycan-N-acetylglucosamine deacetylase